MESQREKNVQVLFSTYFENHQPVSSRFIIYNKISAGFINSKNLFHNDLFQIGGLNSLRGFNENEFFAKRCALSAMEARYFFEEKSYLMAFYDQGFLNISTVGHSNSNPSGLGVGMALNVKTGLLKLVYAIGSRKGQTFDIGHSKIHFGFETVF
jgi:hemolysin activation/secretion protein